MLITPLSEESKEKGENRLRQPISILSTPLPVVDLGAIE